MTRPGRQEVSGNKEQCKAEKLERKWVGKRNFELNSRDSRAGGESLSLSEAGQ